MEPIIQTIDELREYMKDKYDCDVFVTQEVYDKLHKIPLGDIQSIFCVSLAYMHNINIPLAPEQEEA